MTERQPDEEVQQIAAGSSIQKSLGVRMAWLVVVQAASAMALTGLTRATASEIAARVTEELGAEVTASAVGQILSKLNVRTVTSRGKSRYVLDSQPLEQLRGELEAEFVGQAEELELVISTFGDLTERVMVLAREWQKIREAHALERDLTVALAEVRQRPSMLKQLQAEASRLEQAALQEEQLREECREMSKELKALPPLEKRREALSEAIATYEAEAGELKTKEGVTASRQRALEKREAQLHRGVEMIRKREGIVELAGLETAIEDARQELAGLSKQLGEKRSLLERLIGRRGPEARR